MTSIGIVGAGVSALHLGLRLRQYDIPVTIYTARSGEDVAAGRLLNTVAHHDPTLERERELGVHYWDAAEYGYVCHYHFIGGPDPLVFRGDLAAPSSAVDYRLYLPRLLEDFEERGGLVEIRDVGAADVERVADRHDLLVVAAGAGAFGELFPRRAERCPYDRPQRRLCAALYHGVAPTVPRGVTLTVIPGHGEVIEVPVYSLEGHVTGLIFEAIPGGDLEILADLPVDENPAVFERLVLGLLRQHCPLTAERVDSTRFGITRLLDVLQGGVTPSLRKDYAQLPNGKFALAVGDTHALVDPVTGQGANSASYSAWTAAEVIVEDHGFDELFCQRVARRRADVVGSIVDWTNLMLAPPAPHLLALFAAMASDKGIADEVTTNFARPARQWSILATAERTRSYLRARGLDLDEVLGGTQAADHPEPVFA